MHESTNSSQTDQRVRNKVQGSMFVHIITRGRERENILSRGEREQITELEREREINISLNRNNRKQLIIEKWAERYKKNLHQETW